jgi:adenylylsulfate kinase
MELQSTFACGSVGQWMGKMMETKQRTLARMISYRITAWSFTIFYTWLFTGNITAATGFATVLHILLSVDYYIHERVWLKIKWGLK